MPAKKEEPRYTNLPNSAEAERNVLCCIMRDTERQLDIIAQLNPVDFYQPSHAIIFETMADISRGSHKEGDDTVANVVNFTTVVDALRRSGKLSEVGDIDYITTLLDMLPSTANFDQDVAIVKRCSIMRKLISICGEVTKKAYNSDNAEETIAFAEEEIFKLSHRGTSQELVPLADVTARALYTISQRYVNPEKFRGIQTGFRQFDRLTNGLHGGELIVLAARPGGGKSAMAMNMVENVAKTGKTVAIFSLEMSNQQLVERLLSSMSAVPLEYIKNGQLPHGETDLSKLRVAQEIISSKMRLFGNDTVNVRPSEIASQCRRLKNSQYGLDLVVVDYIQLMTSDSTSRDESRQNQVANITRAFKILAKELDVPVIALSQLKREAEIRNIKGEKAGSSEPVLSDLRESGAIEQDADIVLFIHKDTTSQSAVANYSLIVAKHRNGETASIPVTWLGKMVRFVDQEGLATYNLQNRPAEEPSAEEDDGFINLGDDSEETFQLPDDTDMLDLPDPEEI